MKSDYVVDFDQPAQFEDLSQEDECDLLAESDLSAEEVAPEPLILQSRQQSSQAPVAGSIAAKCEQQTTLALAHAVSKLKQEALEIDDDVLLCQTLTEKSEGNNLLELTAETQSVPGAKENDQDGSDEWAKYRIISVLGEGSYGKVYKVQRLQSVAETTASNQQSLGKKAHTRKQALVVKELQTDQMPKREALQAMNEIELVGQLEKCPFVVKYVDSFISGQNKVNIVMEYCQGGDLQAMLRARRQNNRPLSETTIVRFLIQLCLALDQIHKKRILHRDLKAQNIFLTAKQDEVRIGDFGLAKQQNKNLHEQSSSELLQVDNSQSDLRASVTDLDRFEIENTSKVGTPFYLAPELALSDEDLASADCRFLPYTPKSDMWALGVILYEMCALRKPFVAASEPQLYKKVKEAKPASISTASRQLMQIIRALLSKEPSKRPMARDILDMDYIRSKALILRMELPVRRVIRQAPSVARFQEGFKKLVQKQQAQIRSNPYSPNKKQLIDLSRLSKKVPGRASVGDLKKSKTQFEKKPFFELQQPISGKQSKVELRKGLVKQRSRSKRGSSMDQPPPLSFCETPRGEISTRTTPALQKYGFQKIQSLRIGAVKKYTRVVEAPSIISEKDRRQTPIPVKVITKKPQTAVLDKYREKQREAENNSLLAQIMAKKVFAEVSRQPPKLVKQKSNVVQKAPSARTLIASNALQSPCFSQQKRFSQFSAITKPADTSVRRSQQLVSKSGKPEPTQPLKQAKKNLSCQQSRTEKQMVVMRELVEHNSSRNIATTSVLQAKTVVPKTKHFQEQMQAQCSSFEPSALRKKSIRRQLKANTTRPDQRPQVKELKRTVYKKENNVKLVAALSAYSSSDCNFKPSVLTRKFNELLDQVQQPAGAKKTAKGGRSGRRISLTAKQSLVKLPDAVVSRF